MTDEHMKMFEFVNGKNLVLLQSWQENYIKATLEPNFAASAEYFAYASSNNEKWQDEYFKAQSSLERFARL